MGRRIRKAVYWQDAPIVREQIVLIPTTLDDRIPEDHPVRLVDSLLSKLDWSLWESYYHGAIGQPPIHPSILCKVWIFALMRRIRSTAESLQTKKGENRKGTKRSSKSPFHDASSNLITADNGRTTILPR